MLAKRFDNRFGRLVISVALGLWFALPAMGLETTNEIVGEISTVIGQSVIHRTSGEQFDAARGQRIRAGDRIETGQGGHVHIRFVDGGLVSVRPLSRLLVETYRNGDTGTLAAIKFKLEEGVIRSVTGQWGEANRDRFRLNTPIAAIGVKGTDFVVKVEGGNTFASVVSGAIVMAPLEGACAASLGPCYGERSALLSAEMQGKMLEYIRQNGGAPHLVPAADLLVRHGGETQVQVAESRATVISSADAANLIRANDPRSNNAISGTTRPLVWLHNVFGWNVPENTISERFSAASAAGRTAVVGNFFINLYRDETMQANFLPIGKTANFQLSSASASFVQPIAYGRPAENVQISNATLSVDFVGATFVTKMNLSSPSLGQDSFKASGSIAGNGVFLANGTNQNLAGAFSTDSLQAGYSFDKTVAGGKVSGLTLWGR